LPRSHGARSRCQSPRGDIMTPRKSDLIIIASATARPDREAEFESALRDVAGPTRAQPGCVQFQLLRSTANRATLVGFERWASGHDHQQHLAGAHVQTLMARMADLLAEPPSIVAYEIDDE